MATDQKTLFTDSDPAIDQTGARFVEDYIRYLASESTVLLALIADGKVEQGKVKRGKGMVQKKSATNPRVEAFTHSPRGLTKTVTAVSTLDITFAAVTDVNPRDVFVNTANDTECIVDSISGSVCSMISLGSTFTAAIGDVLLWIGNAYEYGSSEPVYVQRPDDQICNVMQICRFPCEISRSLRSTKQLAGGDYFERMKMYLTVESMQAWERNLIWGQKSNTSTTNVTALTSLVVSVPHMEGLWNFAQNSYNFANNMTPEKIRKDLILSMDRVVGNTKPLLWLMGRESRARMIEFQNEGLVNYKPGELEKFGIKSDTFITSGPDVKIIAHDAFDYGANVDKGLLFIPEELRYYYKEGFDLHPRTNIQSNSKDGFKDEITGEACILPLCGGYTLTKTTNHF